MAGWTAGVTAIFVTALVPVNGTCLGYGALVNSTTPIRGNGIAKTRAFCLRLPVHEMFIVIIKANAIRFEEDAGNRRKPFLRSLLRQTTTRNGDWHCKSVRVDLSRSDRDWLCELLLTHQIRVRGNVVFSSSSSSSSHLCAGQRLTPHNRTLEVRPGRITKKLELKYD